MPVRKFRSVVEMPPPPPLPPLDPRNHTLACDLSTTAARLRPLRFPAGVRKHRSLTEALPAGPWRTDERIRRQEIGWVDCGRGQATTRGG